MRDENYRPQVIEFDFAHDGSIVPENLGTYQTAEDAQKFLAGNFVVFNQSITVARHMDFKEKTDIRREYNELLETKLPIYERDLSVATQEFNEAKRKMGNCQELVNATLTEARALATEVKRGIVEMHLDDLFTYRLPYKGRYYYYTFIDKALRLCAIRDIPDHEKQEIWNAMASNDQFIDDNYPRQNEQVAAYQGQEK